ncbi:MAG: malonate transporter subunit MadL [Pseudomonadales bacterium]|nr:malonate transporter subunit MadL [Pseudomonadales bacterium]
MIVYGVALLGICLLAGVILGDLIGQTIGVQANVGGVGIAMLLLVVVASKSNKRIQLGALTGQGISFWSAMYIPIVVAMAAKQNVLGAIEGGPLALLAGIAAVVASFVMIPLLSRIGEPAEPLPILETQEKVDSEPSSNG